MLRPDNFSDVCSHADCCALAGAAAFFAGIPDAAVVVNGPLWCYFYAMRHLEDSLPLLSQRMHCTQLDNESIVFGSEEYLRETLQPYVQEPPALLCIESNCSASLIGDDTAGIARDMGIHCPVVVFDSGGLTGGFAEGYVKASLAVLDTLSLQPNPHPEPQWVNLLGLTTGYYNGVNDRRELVRLLQLAGYTVNTCPGDGTFAGMLSDIPRAALNIVVHEELGLAMAQALKDRLGMPFIVPGIPYGTAGTKRWFEAIQAVLPAPSMPAALSEIERVRNGLLLRINDFKMTWDELWFDEVVIAAPPSTAFGLAEALRTEWADTGHLTVIVQQAAAGSVQQPTGSWLDTVYSAAVDGENIQRHLAQMKSGLVMGSSNESSLLRRAGCRAVQLFPVAFPVEERILLTDAPFMGLRGAQYIQECLWNEKIGQIFRGVPREEQE
jgi:nitrogenase molybdenum-iron protein alpha/beta subunit